MVSPFPSNKPATWAFEVEYNIRNFTGEDGQE